jgi:hypothetical protein
MEDSAIAFLRKFRVNLVVKNILQGNFGGMKMNINIANNMNTNAFNSNLRALDNRARAGGRNSRQAAAIQDRIREREHEMKLREKEDERVMMLRERMGKVRDSDMDVKQKFDMLESLEGRIKQIYDNRANREEMAAERELQRQQAILEEASQMQQENTPRQSEAYNTDPEKEEERQRHAEISGITRIAVAKDKINELQRTRGSLKTQAWHVKSAMSSENSNYVKVGTIPEISAGEVRKEAEIITNVQSGFGNNDFRNRHLNKLNEGIVKIDAAIKYAVSDMYRESAKKQEDRLAQNRLSKEQQEEQEENVYDV